MRNFDLSLPYRSTTSSNRLSNLLENNQGQSGGSYSPYNVELIDENHYRTATAVTGSVESELEITTQDNLLVVRGTHVDDRKGYIYLYQDIAEHNFEHKSQLTESIYIHGANLVDSLLYIDLEHVIPGTDKLRRIEID